MGTVVSVICPWIIQVDKDFAASEEEAYGLLLEDHLIRNPDGSYETVNLDLDALPDNIGLFAIQPEELGYVFDPETEIVALKEEIADFNYWIVEEVISGMSPSEKARVLRSPLFVLRRPDTILRPIERYEGREYGPNKINANSADIVQNRIVYGNIVLNSVGGFHKEIIDHETIGSFLGARHAGDGTSDGGLCAGRTDIILTQDEKDLLKGIYTMVLYNVITGDRGVPCFVAPKTDYFEERQFRD